MKVLSAVAWPYANGPRHIGHVAGFGVPSDVFSRYMRMAGHDVLMVSGTDEHGTPILVLADQAGRHPARARRHATTRSSPSDLTDLGCSYDLFTRTTTRNHYAVAQELFTQVWTNGYMVEQTTQGAISPVDRPHPARPLHRGHLPDLRLRRGPRRPVRQLRQPARPDRPDQPAQPDQRRDAGVRRDPALLPRPARARRRPAASGSRSARRRAPGGPTSSSSASNLLDDIRPRAMTRDIDWGIPVPLDGWRDNPTKRLYVWFDAVIGYLSASIEWARRTGRPRALARVVERPRGACRYYFMGKDNITFHSQIWPAELLGVRRQGRHGRRARGRTASCNLPTEVVVERVPHHGGQAVLHLARLRHLRARRARALRARRAALLHLRGRPGEPGHRLHLGASSCSATTPSSSPAGATSSTARPR